MAYKALKGNTIPVVSLAPAARTSATNNGTGIDLANSLANKFDIVCGVITDGTHTPKLQDSADNSTFADVAAADQVGTFSAITSTAGTQTPQSVSYIGTKRYVRLVTTVTGATTGGIYAGVAQLEYRKQN